MSETSRRPIAGMTIQQKLPLLVSGFVLAVIVLYSWGSYEAVRAASLDVARQRLGSLSEQVAGLLDQSGKAEMKAMHVIATDPAVVSYIASPRSASKEAALAALKKAPRADLAIRTEILDANGEPIDATVAASSERHEELASDIAKSATGPDFAAVGRFRLINDTLVYPSVAAVVQNDKPVGYIVRWRRVSGTTQARDQFMGLLGTKAALYIGNDRGDVWTDLAAATPKPPQDAKLQAGKLSEYDRPGVGTVVATTHAVPSVPWVVLVEFSEQGAMAPAQAFLKRASYIGLGILLVATLLVWIATRSVTRPLTDLTDAAAALAAGDYSTVVESGRTDELGQLSHAFNAMIGQVEAAHEGLEEKVRERTEQLRERNEELETFGHSISHDLRAPIRAMGGFSQALLEDCGDQLDDTGKDYAQRVVAASRRMDALIQDLLAYSRVSRADIDITNVSLADVATEALAQVEGQVAETGATILIAPDLPTVRGHRVTLVQSVTNLIANGLKFVPKGRTPNVVMRAERNNGNTRIWVEDNGIGIDAAHHERVFGVFERLHQNDQYTGTGIGLAIVRKSVERMGGRVGVVSAMGEGSKFWIELTSVGGAS
jgi:signal transduction histidine kinase